MQNLKLFRVALFLFALIALAIGAFLLIDPIGFEASSGILLDGDVSLLSEIRAYGGLLLAGGLIMLRGVFVTEALRLGYGAAVLFYASIGLSRVVAILLDGMPASSILTATLIELLIGAFAGWAYWKLRRSTSQKQVDPVLSF